MARSEGRICRHLHLPLQSGNSKVLREMHRPYDAEYFEGLVERLYAAMPMLSLSTDIICGFPGETDQEFNDTVELAKRCRFTKVHVFPYSKRQGTPAAERADQVEPEVRSARAKHLREVADALRAQQQSDRAGSTELALVEEAGQAMTESYFEVPAPQRRASGSWFPSRSSLCATCAPVHVREATTNGRAILAGMTDSTHITLTAPPSVNMALVVGAGDCLLHIIEEAFDARITVRGDSVVLEGDSVEVQSLWRSSPSCSNSWKAVEPPDQGFIQRSLDLLRTAEFTPSMLREDILLTYRGRAIRPKTAGQKHYVDAIRKNTITFGIGPAGTGKTYLAMGHGRCCPQAQGSRAHHPHPSVVEAGENLGFLPGSLNEKVDPYIRPLYDALFDMTDMERAQQLIESNVIEIAPLAFMRGRTLNDSFVILDEAQNTTPEQMKMFLTRLGFGSKMVITGDITQLDLPRGVSGLKGIEDILGDIEGVSFCRFSGKDVVRHSLVAAIVSAYDRAQADAMQKKGSNGRSN